jgi:hypothetical protein
MLRALLAALAVASPNGAICGCSRLTAAASMMDADGLPYIGGLLEQL